MRWEIILHSQLTKSPRDWLLQAGSALPAIVIEQDSQLLPIILPDSNLDHVPTIIYSKADLENPATWQYILKLHPLPKIELARYSKQHSEIDQEAFLRALGSKINFRTLEHWHELADLDDNTTQLVIHYDFNINILRLWNRFTITDRQVWQAIWDKRNVRKNLIREMIEDYYDLAEQKKSAVLKMAFDFEQGWGESDAVFPAEKLRDIVRQARFPEMTKVKQAVESVQRQLKLPRNVRLSIPNDLELDELELSIKFQSSTDYEQIIHSLAREDVKMRIAKLMQLL